MASLAELLQENEPVRAPQFAEWVAELPDRDRTALEAAARDPRWSNAALREQVRAAGSTVGKDQFSAWRRSVLARG
jgi:hypothetical protein